MKKLFLFLLFISAAYSQPEVPQLKNWANDFTNTLSQDQLNSLNIGLKNIPGHYQQPGYLFNDTHAG